MDGERGGKEWLQILLQNSQQGVGEQGAEQMDGERGGKEWLFEILLQNSQQGVGVGEQGADEELFGNFYN